MLLSTFTFHLICPTRIETTGYNSHIPAPPLTLTQTKGHRKDESIKFGGGILMIKCWVLSGVTAPWKMRLSWGIQNQQFRGCYRGLWEIGAINLPPELGERSAWSPVSRMMQFCCLIPANSASGGRLAALPPPWQSYRHPFSWLSIPIQATMIGVNKRGCKWDFEKGHFSLYANIFRADWWHSGNNAKINQWWEQQFGVQHKYVHSTLQESQGRMGHRSKDTPVFDRIDRMGYGWLVSVSVHAEWTLWACMLKEC